jgi:hypothetical protein
MRKVVLLIGLVGLGLAGCASAQTAEQRTAQVAHGAADKTAQAAHATAQAASGAAHKTAEVAHDVTHPVADPIGMDKPEKEGVKGAVQAPLEDVNLIRRQIPPVLLHAEAAPYARPSPASCREITSEVADLDDALGDDFDVYVVDDSSPDAKHGRQAGEAVVLAMRDTAEDFIPFRSWVRRLSGAQAHDNQVRAAVYAGRVRRSYLKGLGEAIGCRYPAAPKGASPLPVVTARRR